MKSIEMLEIITAVIADLSKKFADLLPLFNGAFDFDNHIDMAESEV